MNDIQPTHYIECRHQIGRNGYDYTMRCALLGMTKSGNAKILLFGERAWKNFANKRSIRYIAFSRLRELKPTNTQPKEEAGE